MATVTPIKAKVLILHGWQDPYAKPELVPAIAQELTAAQADWQIHAYGSAGHGFSNTEGKGDTPGIFYHADTDVRSWHALTNFLTELFGELH